MLPPPIAKPRPSSGIPLIGMALVGCLPMPLKRLYYQSRGATLGKRVSIGLFSYIDSPDLRLDDDVHIAPFTFIRTRNACHIGKRSRIHAFTAIDTGSFSMGEDSAIGEQVAIGGLLTPRSRLSIGSRSKIFSYSFINPTEPIEIGDEVCIGGGTYLFTHGTWQSMLDGFPGKFGAVTIKNRSWIAWRSFIMPGITIGEDCTIGAGSVVTHSIPDRVMAAGSPARIIKSEAQHILPHTPEQKHDLLVQWLSEFSAYLTYIGHEANFSNDEKSACIEVQGAPAVSYFRHHPQFAQGIILSLEALDQNLRQSLNASRISWFDLERKECALGAHSLTPEFRTFLTRYGVRFCVVAS